VLVTTAHACARRSDLAEGPFLTLGNPSRSEAPPAPHSSPWGAFMGSGEAR
jgi:hypothetical protein